ncbi:MAG: FRG domain-containing protein [Deltaproteobacteria bacterium]|nr:FRG domain-containing protein [Deltaproteobacteria bacterium]
MECNDLVIRSWGELCERLYDESWQEDLRRFRSNFAFRGVSDARYRLRTSLMRLHGSLPQIEYHLLRNFKKYAQLGGPEALSDWRWLTLAQHHGLPTRLLDWTYSPFIAMHFATSRMEKFDRDGAIWHVDFVRAHRFLPQRLQELLAETQANAFTIDMLEKIVPTLKDFDKASRNGFVMFFEPPSIDARIVNQFALFSIMPSATATLADWLTGHPELFRRIIIPKELKWEIRDKLDQANITERMLFPGLDGLALWLKRHYSPRDVPHEEADTREGGEIDASRPLR